MSSYGGHVGGGGGGGGTGTGAPAAAVTGGAGGVAGAHGGGSAAGGGGGHGYAPNPEAEAVHEQLSHYLLLVLGVISSALLLWRFGTIFFKYMRTIACLNNDRQRYFARADGRMSWFKKNVLYAPIFSQRHNREFQLSRAINVGTLPTRLQLFFLIGYFATNVAFCVLTIDFSKDYSSVARLVRNRTGVLSTVNMVPLFLLAGRNNPLIALLGISFDTYNLVHRWLGRIVALEALAHTVAFLAGSAHTKGWSAAFQTVFNVRYMLWGFIVSFRSLIFRPPLC